MMTFRPPRHRSGPLHQAGTPHRESKEDYYAVLQTSSTGWHDGKHDLLPWLNYFLAVVRRAYIQFEERAGQVKSPRGAKTALIEAAIASFPGEFGLSDVERIRPGVSRDMVRRTLQVMQRSVVWRGEAWRAHATWFVGPFR